MKGLRDRERDVRARRLALLLAIASVVGVCVTSAKLFAAEIVRFPDKDGTLLDGGVYGAFDGAADDWDWTFNESGYEGTISRTVTGPNEGLEHRVFWEYNLAGVTSDRPVYATLTFTLRGVSAFPFPDSEVHVYAYPADSWETPADYSMGPAVLQDAVTVLPNLPPREYALDVSAVLNETLFGGDTRIAFRFQINPDTTSMTAQTFIDALDAESETKPYLTIDDSVPGDADDDGDVDLEDFAVFASCMEGPGSDVEPACEFADLDPNGDVDLRDLRVFQCRFTGSR